MEFLNEFPEEERVHVEYLELGQQIVLLLLLLYGLWEMMEQQMLWIVNSSFQVTHSRPSWSSGSNHFDNPRLWHSQEVILLSKAIEMVLILQIAGPICTVSL